MRADLRFLLIATLVGGCASERASRRGDTPATSVEDGRTEVAQHAVDERDPQGRGVPDEARRLVTAHNELVAEGPTLEHRYVVDALESLAAALEVVAPDKATEIVRVRESARQLARSDVSAQNHAELLRDALGAAARALRDVPLRDREGVPSIHQLRLEQATRAVVNASRALELDAPLMEQYELVRIGMRQATRAVFAALEADEPRLDVYTARR